LFQSSSGSKPRHIYFDAASRQQAGLGLDRPHRRFSGRNSTAFRLDIRFNQTAPNRGSRYAANRASSKSSPPLHLSNDIYSKLCFSICCALQKLRSYGLALVAVRCAGLSRGRIITVNIRLTEASMSRYHDWEQYKQHTWLLLPLFI